MKIKLSAVAGNALAMCVFAATNFANAQETTGAPIDNTKPVVTAPQVLPPTTNNAPNLLPPNATTIPQPSPVAKAGYLGVTVEPVSPSYWRQLQGVAQNRGLMVRNVAPGSAAQRAAIQQNDILLTYGDQQLFAPHQLWGLVHADAAGRAVKLDGIRDGKPITFTAILSEEPVREPDRQVTQRPFRQDNQPLANASWDTFDSLALQNLGNGRYRAEIGYKATDGQLRNLKFEGTRSEIGQAIIATADMPASQRNHLLSSLGLSYNNSNVTYLVPDDDYYWPDVSLPFGLPWSIPIPFLDF